MIKVAVTGIGIISSIGYNYNQTIDSILSKNSGISKIEILDTIHRDDFLIGEIKLSHEELIKLAKVDNKKPWTRTALLGIIATKQAISDSGITTDNTDLISATTVGGMDRSELYYYDMVAGRHKEFIDTHHAGNSTEMIADSCNISGLITTVSTACSSSLNSIGLGARLVSSGKSKKVVVGGCDALSKFTLNGFNTLMILDKEHCRPMDETRAGLNLGEGAAYLVLEDYQTAISEGKHIYALVTGYANSNDAFHQTASSDNGQGPFLAMKNAIKSAGISPKDISYINAHGTGTHNNDLTEGLAINRLFADCIPPLSSTKAFTGHTLGAAGSIESVISLIALNKSITPPNINFKNQIPEIKISPATEPEKIENCNHVLTNSFGFGGNDSSVVFSKPATYDTPDRIASFNKNVFINGIGCISPQNTFDGNISDGIIDHSDEKFLQIIKPVYRNYIDAKLLRRMSKIVRMGIVSSSQALKDASIETPDAIVTGTGMGCQEDTEKFLKSMIINNEELLTPTSFIQSTHNTVGGSIALGLKNHNYNITYVHRNFSFETCLIDAIDLINNNTNKVLVGGFDEITEESWLIKTKIGYFKPLPPKNNNIVNDTQPGGRAGEGAAFFVLSDNKDQNTYAKLVDVGMHYKPKSFDSTIERITEFLGKNNVETDDIDIVISGENGDAEFDKIYADIQKRLFKNKPVIKYKELVGEYDSSSSFAVWLASNILKNNLDGGYLKKHYKINNKVCNVLIYNQFRNVSHSLILLTNAN